MKKIYLYMIISLTAAILYGCGDNGIIDQENEPEEAIYNYYYTVSVPEGFKATVLYFYHEEPLGIPQSSGWMEGVIGNWESDVYMINPDQPLGTPTAEIRVRDMYFVDQFDGEDYQGDIIARIYVEGEIADEIIMEMPNRASFSLGFNFRTQTTNKQETR